MCHVIDSENILLNYFSKAKSDEISFKDLREFRKKIEAEFQDSVYVDITLGSLRDAVSQHKDILDIELTKISFKHHELQKLDIIELVDKSINCKLPSNIRDRYLEVISELESVNE